MGAITVSLAVKVKIFSYLNIVNNIVSIQFEISSFCEVHNTGKTVWSHFMYILWGFFAVVFLHFKIKSQSSVCFVDYENST